MPITRSQESGLSESWLLTRRNVVGMWSILAGSLLSGCNAETSNIMADDDANHHRHKPNCYLKGTQILTSHGEQSIEELEIGDLVVVFNGEAKPVKWIGRRMFRRAANEKWFDGIKPVRVSRGALGPDVPHADLFISQNHRLHLDGLLIRAADIVNGTSIALDACEKSTEIEYLHVMVEGHNVIVAEGAPSETLLAEESTLRLFDNCFEYGRLYDIPADKSELPCAPVYADCGRRARLRSHLRSALSPLIDRRSKFDKARDRWMIHNMVA